MAATVNPVNVMKTPRKRYVSKFSDPVEGRAFFATEVDVVVAELLVTVEVVVDASVVVVWTTR